jgi:hypothetical protein
MALWASIPSIHIAQNSGRVIVHCGQNPDAMQQIQFSDMLAKDYSRLAEGNVNNCLTPFLFWNRGDIWRLAPDTI